MVAVPTREIDAFILTGFRQFAIILLYGPNEGLVSERAEAIARATTQGDTGNILRFDGDDLAADPLRLSDEANAIAMFGGIRAIRIKAGAKSLAAALEPIISTAPVDARVIIEAGDLKANHALRNLLEKPKSTAVIACYAEDKRDIGRFVDDILRSEQRTIVPDARLLLIDLLGQDRKRSRMELEKLLLYCRGAQQITSEDIEAVLTDAAQISPDAVIDATFLGKLESIETEARRILADGFDAAVLLGFVLRHIFLLSSIKQAASQNQNVSESIKAHRISWKREKAVAEQVDRWTLARLDRATQIIAQATLNIRRNAPLAEALAIRALWSLALSVSRK